MIMIYSELAQVVSVLVCDIRDVASRIVVGKATTLTEDFHGFCKSLSCAHVTFAK